MATLDTIFIRGDKNFCQHRLAAMPADETQHQLFVHLSAAVSADQNADEQ